MLTQCSPPCTSITNTNRGRKVRQFIEGLCEYIINNRRAELVKLVPVDPIEQGAVAALSGRGSHSDDDNEDLEMDMDDLNGRYDKVARASASCGSD